MVQQHEAAEEQRRLWNGVAGRNWIEAQEVLDRVFTPIEESLLEPLDLAAGGRLLDVGCGTGSTTLAAARRLGAGDRALGIDVSELMIAAARARAEREGIEARFILADAQRHPFEPESLDLVLSRFGVMFFGDTAAAFANLRRATRREGRLRFVAWRSPEENPFMTTAERAAAPLLPDLPPRRAGLPGPFAFADDARLRANLEEAGWAAVEIRPVDLTCSLSEDDLTTYLTRLGPVGRRLAEVDQDTRARVTDALRLAYAPFVTEGEVSFTAACWMVSASAG